jgi:RNA polymerase sigma factor (sigma-70 family)
MDDNTHLRQFVEAGSQESFRELVGRHTNLVYACAMQRLRDPHAAEDVTQAVFLTLALKAKNLRSHTSLAGWLFTTTRYVATRYQRGEQRRKEREMRAFEETPIADSGTATEAAWEHMQPHLAGALDSLSGADREAVLLRFYRKASHREVAAALGTSEDGARMRVDRALDKLRRFFAKKSVALSATALAGALTANAAQAAPAGLAATAGATALAGAGGTLTVTSTLVLAKGAIQMMFIAQLKTAALIMAACVVVAGSGVIVAKDVLTPPASPATAGGETITGVQTGVVMAVVIPDRVVTPPRGEETKFEIGLRISNRTSQDISFGLFDTVRPVLKDDQGRERPLDGGRDKTRILKPIQVKTGQTDTVLYAARLSLPTMKSFVPAGKTFAELAVDDRTGGIWVYHDLAPGRYTLGLHYAHPPIGGVAQPGIWVGETTTAPSAFVIVNQPDGSAVKQKGPESKAAVKDGLQVVVRLDKAVYATNEPLTFTVIYTNVREKGNAFGLWDAGYFKDWKIMAGDWEVAGWPESERSVDGAFLKTLGAGEQLEAPVKIGGDGAAHFFSTMQRETVPPRLFLPPGKYPLRLTISLRETSLTLRRALPRWVGEISTEPVEFEVGGPAAAR